MKITNSLLFVAFVLGAGSLLPAQDHQSVASPMTARQSANTAPASLPIAVCTAAQLEDLFTLAKQQEGQKRPKT